MIVNGLDLSGLKHKADRQFTVLETVPGRVVQIDADFLAYQVSADDTKSISEMRHNCDMLVEKMRLMSGSEKAVLHLTPKGSTKGDRYEVAILKEYQANRAGKVKPKFLHIMREWMHKERGAVLHMTCEADDGMSIAQYTAIKEGNRNLSVIASKDKDLTMVPGLMLDWDTGEITDTADDFGTIWIDDTKSTKKLRGRGQKFFWAQMLMGDTADNISGLPLVCDPQYLKGKPKLCGPIMAHDILAPCTTNKEAFEVVKNLFKLCGEHKPFTHYKTGEVVPYGQVFQSEAQLLWMRRELDIGDALKWMKETCL